MLKYSCTILLGQQLRVYTDHIKLTSKILNTDRVFLWRLIIEEYGRKIKYIPMAKNIVEDDISTFLSNGKPKSTPKSNYVAETLLDMYGV